MVLNGSLGSMVCETVRYTEPVLFVLFGGRETMYPARKHTGL